MRVDLLTPNIDMFAKGPSNPSEDFGGLIGQFSTWGADKASAGDNEDVSLELASFLVKPLIKQSGIGETLFGDNSGMASRVYAEMFEDVMARKMAGAIPGLVEMFERHVGDFAETTESGCRVNEVR